LVIAVEISQSKTWKVAEYQVEELERKLRELRGGDKQKPIDVSKLRK
jgi:hypothetical protein